MSDKYPVPSDLVLRVDLPPEWTVASRNPAQTVTPYTYVANTEKYPFAAILGSRSTVFRSHWDSGQPDTAAVELVVWDGERPVFVTLSADNDYETQWPYSQTKRYVLPTVATDHNVQFAREAYEVALTFLEDVSKVATDANKLDMGVTVDVVKGRKAPKGRYEVTGHKEGQYGPYVNLRAADGKFQNYVDVKNVKVVPDYAGHFLLNPRFRNDPVLEKFLEAGEASHFANELDFLVIADYIAEHEHQLKYLESLSSVERNGAFKLWLTPERFAVALRSAVKHNKIGVDEYAVTRHNEFRRPRY